MRDVRSRALRPDGVLGTKLLVPMPRCQVVLRPRLLDLLDAGALGPLTLLAAQPGAGKTLLLTSWVASGRPPGPVAWVTVDPGDDPGRLWAHVLAALQGTGALPPDGLLAGRDPSGGLGERFLPLLVNGLAELASPVVLVLDDLNEAADPAVTAELGFLLRHAPSQLRLVVATRADPALPLHRLRVDGQLTEVRAAELAFTPTEAGELLAGLGVDLPDGAVESLWTRTEGWAAGLRLVALSLRGHPEPERFVADFAGDDRAVAGYLLQEVLARQPPEVQEFLLRTCVAERLCGALADALTGRTGGERMLAWLERDHVFTSRPGPSRSWYRYHPLFAELLRAELCHGRAEEVPELHRRAAAWHAANGLVAEAVHHALAGGDAEEAAGLLAAHWFAMLVEGRAATLRDLLGRLPADQVRANRELVMVAAISRLALGELDDADAWLRLADDAERSGARRPRAEAARSLAGLLRARAHGDVGEAVVAAGELLAPPPGARPERPAEAEDQRALVMFLLGATELWSVRLDDAAGHLEEGITAASRAGREYLAFTATAQLALLEAVRGRLGRAERLGREAADLARRSRWSSSPEVACAELALAWAAYHRDDLPGALDSLGRAGRAAHAAGDQRVAVAVAIAEARLAVNGDREDAAHRLARLRDAVWASATDGWWPPLITAAARPVEARLLLASGDEAAAEALLAGAGTQPGTRTGGAGPGERPAVETVLLARLRLVRGDPTGAAGILAPVLGGEVPVRSPATLIEAWLLDAVAHRKLADHEAAADSLERALDLAAPEGYRRVFVEGGGPVRALLADHLQRHTAQPELVRTLLDGLLSQVTVPAAPVTAVSTTPAVSAMVEPLSERERVVLRYLPSMLSAGEIAAELYVSVNTVKTHIKSIYRKLDTNRRWDAVRRARQLRLL